MNNGKKILSLLIALNILFGGMLTLQDKAQAGSISASWDFANKFIDQSFWNDAPVRTDGHVKRALFGTTANQATYYTKNRSGGNSCNPAAITEVDVYPGQLPSTLVSNTVYVLYPGDHIVSSPRNISGSCIGLIGGGNGTRILSNNTIPAIITNTNNSNTHGIVVDGIEFDGQKSSSLVDRGVAGRNDYGIYIYRDNGIDTPDKANITINNIKSNYTKIAGISFVGVAAEISNTQTMYSSGYGITSRDPADGTPPNVFHFSGLKISKWISAHNANGFLALFAQNLTISDSEIYGNSSSSIYIGASFGFGYPNPGKTVFNNVKILNNNGQFFLGEHNGSGSYTLNNIIYANNSEGLEIYGSGNAINNSQFYNNTTYGIRALYNYGLLVYNSMIYNNNTGIDIRSFPGGGNVKLSNLSIFNNNVGLYTSSVGRTNVFHGQINLFGNGTDIIGTDIINGWNYASPLLGSGVINTGNSMSCDRYTNITNSSNSPVMPSPCTNRQQQSRSSTSPFTYQFGNNVYLQKMPYQYSGGDIISSSLGFNSAMYIGDFTLDSNFPVITISGPAIGTGTSKTVSASVSETSTMFYIVTTNTNCNNSVTFSNIYTPNQVLTFSTTGDNGKYVCFKATDSANNTTYGISAQITGIVIPATPIDNTVPTISVYNPNTNQETAKSVSATLNEAGTLLYSVNYSTTCDNSLNFITGSIVTFSSTSDNLKYVCFKGYDLAGNGPVFALSNQIGNIVQSSINIIINEPDTYSSSYKTITASTNIGSLYYATTRNSICDNSLNFYNYSSLTFYNNSDNGTRICYKAVDSYNNTVFRLSNPLYGITQSSDSILDYCPNGDFSLSRTDGTCNLNINSNYNYGNAQFDIYNGSYSNSNNASICESSSFNPNSMSFIDVNSSTSYYNEIRILRAKCVVRGYPGARYYAPQNAIRISEYATMISRVIGNQIVGPDYSYRKYFTDVRSSDRFSKYIHFLYEKGLTKSLQKWGGAAKPYINPYKFITIQQAKDVLLPIVVALGNSESVARSKLDGITSGYGTYLTRSQAANLIVRALNLQ